MSIRENLNFTISKFLDGIYFTGTVKVIPMVAMTNTKVLKILVRLRELNYLVSQLPLAITEI